MDCLAIRKKEDLMKTYYRILFCMVMLADPINTAVGGYASAITLAHGDDHGTSSIRGRVIYTGHVSQSQLVTVHRDSRTCGESLLWDTVGVDPATQGLEGVVISVEGVSSSSEALATRDITLESSHCRFIPRVSATTIGSTITYRNSDPILHNSQLFQPNNLLPIRMNVLQPSKVPDENRVLTESGIFEVRCNIHPFMHASILVFDHPYFTVTDGTGGFRLQGIPAGTYKLRLWHENLGVTEKTLTVGGDGATDLTIELKKSDAPHN
jgi:plastocyanin